MLHVAMCIFRPCWCVLQAVIKDLDKRIGLDEALSPGIPLGQDFFLLKLIQRLALLDAGFNGGRRFLEHGNEFS